MTTIVENNLNKMGKIYRVELLNFFATFFCNKAARRGVLEKQTSAPVESASFSKRNLNEAVGSTTTDYRQNRQNDNDNG